MRGRRAILLIAGSLIAALVLALPGIAHADEWSGSDDFETNSGGWSFTDSGPGIGGFSSTIPTPGSRSAFLHQPGEGWSSVGRQWYVKPVAQGEQVDVCDRGIMVRDTQVVKVRGMG